MNTIIKTEVLGELENPKVVRDSTAEDTGIQSTNDPEQSIDSPTETDLSSKQQKEMVSSPNPLRKSEDIENHAKATAPFRNDVTGESILNFATSSSLRTDEPDLTAETVVTISNVETNRPINSDTAVLPVPESSVIEPEVACSAYLEPSDSSITHLETNPEEEIRKSISLDALLVTPDADAESDGMEPGSMKSHYLCDDPISGPKNAKSAISNSDCEIIAVQVNPDGAFTNDVLPEVNETSSEATVGELSVGVAVEKTPEETIAPAERPKDGVVSQDKNRTTEGVAPCVEKFDLPDGEIPNSKQLSDSENKPIPVDNGEELLEHITCHTSKQLSDSKKSIPADNSGHFLEPLDTCTSWQFSNSESESIPVNNGEHCLEPLHTCTSKQLSVSENKSIPVDNSEHFLEPLDTCNLKQFSGSEKVLPVDYGERCLEPLDTCSLSEEKSWLPEDHAYGHASALKQNCPETKDQKEPELSDTLADLEPIPFFGESSLTDSIPQNLTANLSPTNSDFEDSQKNCAVNAHEGSDVLVPAELQKSFPKIIDVHVEDVMDVSGIKNDGSVIKKESLADSDAGKSVFAGEPNESIQKDQDSAELMDVGAVEAVDAQVLADSSTQLDDDGSHTHDAAKCELSENETKESHEAMDNKLSNIGVNDGSSMMSAIDDLSLGQDSLDVSVQSSKHECNRQEFEEGKKQPEKPSRNSGAIGSVNLLCPKVAETPGTSTEAGSTANMSKPSVSRVTIGQLKRFYQWRNHGLPPNEAVEKAMRSNLTPPTEDPHPNCKIELEEIKEISMLIPASKSRSVFVVETFFGGKDLEKQLKLHITKSGTERHPNCKHSWEDVKAMFSQLPTESLRWDFVVEVYYKGKSQEEVLQIISNAQYCELANLTCSQLEKYCDWCGVGLSVDAALVKAKEFGDIPLIGDPHPECKIPLAEIREMSMLVPDRHKFVVEVFSGGKDPGEVLKKLMTTKPHPKCNHSWEKLKQMANELPKEPQRWKFMVETYYKGKDTLQVMKACKNDADSRRYGIHGLERLENYFKWRNSGLDCNEAFKKAKDHSLVPPNENPHPNCRFSLTKIKEISLSMPTKLQGKLFQLETFFGGKDPEAQLRRIIEHPWDSYSWDDLKQMSSKLPTEYLRLKFMAETYGKHVHPAEVIRNLLSLPIDRPSVLEQGTNLVDQPNVDRSSPRKSHDKPSTAKLMADSKGQQEVDDSTPSKPYDGPPTTKQISLLVDGDSTPEKQMDRLSTSKQVADYQSKVDGSTPEQKNRRLKSSHTVDLHDQMISKLSLNQLKKYYKWCILGLSSSEALSNAKEPGLIPQTEDPHPNCKLPFEEIKQISLLIPAKYARCKFQVETFFGGKDPEAALKLTMASANTERHPDCQHTWEDLQKMSNKLPKLSVKLKFLVETFYEGKEPEKVLEKMVPKSNDPSSASYSSPPFSATSTAKDSVDMQVSSQKNELISEFEISKLSLNQLKKFYKWRNLGVACGEALVKAKEPGLIPQTDEPHPDCKFPFEEIKQMSLLLPPKYLRTLFQVETYFGGKDPEEQLELILAKAKVERHPDCKHSWKELKKMANALPKVSFRLKFVADSFYGGKSPAELLKSMLSVDPYTAASAGDVHFVDGTVEKAAEDASLSKSKKTVRVADSTMVDSSSGASDSFDDGACFNMIKKTVRFVDTTAVDSSSGTMGSHDDHDEIEEGSIGTLSNGKLKLYYLRRNAGFDHDIAFSKASKFEGYAGKHLSKSKLSPEELKKMSQSLHDTILRDRFFILTYFGGKDPNRTLEYIKLDPRNTQQPEANVVKPDSLNRNSFRGLHLLKNGPLQYYFLWRNKGYNHEIALSKVKIREPFPGIHHPHPNCMHSEDQLRYHSQALRFDVFVWNRFIIYTYYGGKDPEITLRYFMSLPETYDPPEDIFEEGMDKHFLLLEEAFPGNKKLRKYYAFRNNGIPHEAAISKAVAGEALGGFVSMQHPTCSYTEQQLRDMSQVLRSTLQCIPPNFYWDRFVIHTYNGGKDPQGTLKYYMELVEKLSKPKDPVEKLGRKAMKKLKRKLEQESQVKDVKPLRVPFEPVAKRTRSCPDAMIPLDSPNHPSNQLNDSQLKNYYSWINNGCSHKDALVNAQTPELVPKRMRSRCLIPMEELRNMAQKLPSEKLRNVFIMETYYAGNIPEEVMENLLSQAANDGGELQRRSPEKMIPLDSPNHPSNQLNDGQLENYYLWLNNGCSQKDALANARTPGLFPKRMPSHCTIPIEELRNMARKLLPTESLRKTFIMETFYAGNVPEEVMEHLLSKATNDRELQQCSSENHPPDLGGHKREDEVQVANQALQELHSNPTILVEESIMDNMTNGELKYYYLWLNKGLGQEQALLNVNKKIKIPGVHEPHPNCKYSEAELGRIGEVLKSAYCRQRFLVHTYFGGKDPQRVMRYFIDAYSPSAGDGAHQANFFGTNYTSVECGPPTVTSPYGQPPGLPVLQHPYQHPAVGLPHAMDQHLAANMPQTTIHPTAYPHGPPVLMMYPPDQYPNVNAATYPAPPHQQLVPSFANVAYPPNLQGAAPTSIHQPHPCGVYNEYNPAVVSASGYPSGVQQPHVVQQLPSHQQPPVLQPPPTSQLPPSHQQPPVPQQPSSLTSNINSTASPAHQTPRAEGPLIGIHDPKQSSLKRKPTDELPIKITLKSTSVQPKPPKQCKQQTTPTIDKSVPMLIVPTSYPSQSLSDSQMDAIESNLLEAILEMDDDGTKPSFKDTCRSNGRFSITCVDQFSVSWLYKYLKTYQPWPGASLKLIDGVPTGMRANAVLPPCKLDDDEKILKYIERQNKGLNVNTWTVIQRWDNDNLNTCIDLVIDKESAAVLKRCSTINFKLGSADIIISENDVSLASSTSQSFDPTKKQSPGTFSQSLPRPPNSLSKSVSRSEKPLLSHDGCERPIPKGTSAKSESSDQDTTPSGEQKHSWMDWFYSKKAASAAPSQDRSSLQETYHKSSGLPQSRSLSPMYRRLSHSRSPSPTYRGWSHCSSQSPKYRSQDCSPDSDRKPKNQRRVSTSPCSSSNEYSSARRSRTGSREPPSWR